MKIDIILAGVGGQGILSIAAAIGTAAVNSGLFLKQAEVHGMSQRGGDVHSDLRISDREIASDLIPHGKADMILSVEPMEALRYLPMLAPDGWLVTNTEPYVNIQNYPDPELIYKEIERIPNHVAIDANKLANEIGSRKSANIVVLGAASPFLGLEFESLVNAIRIIFRTKGEDVIQANLNALEKGREFAKKMSKN
jgi:indolepyruvate ferredoxin oxidoreductase beta subunit